MRCGPSSSHDDVDLHAAERAVVEVVALDRARDETRRRAEARRVVAAAQVVVDRLRDVVDDERIVRLLGLLRHDARGVGGIVAADVEEVADVARAERLEDGLAVVGRRFLSAAAERARRRFGDRLQLPDRGLAQVDVVIPENAEDAVPRAEDPADLRGLPRLEDRAHERLVDHHRRTARLGDHHVHLLHRHQSPCPLQCSFHARSLRKSSCSSFSTVVSFVMCTNSMPRIRAKSRICSAVTS